MKKIFALLLFAFTISLNSNAQVEFIKGDWEMALAKAQESQKPIFVDFYTDWCGWCKVMDNKTFSVDSVGVYMAENYVSLKIDAEEGIGRTLAMKYRISSFPTFAVFTADGSLVTKILGYKEVTPFMEEVRSIKSKVDQGFVLQGGSPELDVPFPDFYVNSFKDKGSKKKNKWPKDSVVNAFLEKEDLMNEVAFNVLFRFGADEAITNHALGMQDQLEQLYGAADVQRILARVAYKEYKKIEKNGTYTDLEAWMPRLEMLMRDEYESYKDHYELSFYKAKEMWKEYAAKIDDMIASDKASNSRLNGISWDIYKKVEDKDLVKKAIIWMAKVAKDEPNYMFVDTYAALLYKDGQYAEAQKQAELAIKLGNESGEKVEDTEKLLKDIKKAQK